MYSGLSNQQQHMCHDAAGKAEKKWLEGSLHVYQVHVPISILRQHSSGALSMEGAEADKWAQGPPWSRHCAGKATWLHSKILSCCCPPSWAGPLARALEGISMPHRGNACASPFNFLSHYGNDKSTICQPRIVYPPFFSELIYYSF